MDGQNSKTVASAMLATVCVSSKPYASKPYG